jgi:TonB-dependent receptor
VSSQIKAAVRAAVALSVTAAAATAPVVFAQQAEPIPPPPPLEESAGGDLATVQTGEGGIEEIVVVGRQRSAATDTLAERMSQPVIADIIGIDQIKRVGDSTVATALRRLPGVTLVGEFIYIRGLGERYSSTTLNGANVPSPDLTRNVIPLDIFPAEIIESLSIQKVYSVDRPAAFGGGNVDIRTRRVPEELVFSVGAGTGWNSTLSDDVLTYKGGGDDWQGKDDGTRALPREISDAIQTYRGDLSPVNILDTLRKAGGVPVPTLPQAEQVNRDLATSLNRNVDLRSESADPDYSFEAALGNSWTLGESEDWRVGALAVGDYRNEWRNRDRINRSAQTPDIDNGKTQRSINTVAVTGSLTAGVEYLDEHKIGLTALYLRNTDDEAALTERFNFNFRKEQGAQLRDYRVRYEERELNTFQVTGSHTLGDATAAMLLDNNVAALGWPLTDLTFSWFYSTATADTEIPNEVTISSVDAIDPVTGEVLQTSVRSTSSAADFRYTELDDEVNSWGWKLQLPLELADGGLVGEAFGGYAYYEKGRSYVQTELALGTTSAPPGVLAGSPGDVLTDDNISDPANGFLLSIGGIGTETYLAGETIDAAYGGVDLTWQETWRLTAGVRWEDWNQLSVPVDPLEFDTAVGKIPLSPEQLVAAAKAEDDYYPSFALTWMHEDFWADDFQLRFGWSRTVARPDLREVANATYIDPFTDARVFGNPALVPSDLENIDLRAEWFWVGGDNFTVSPFYKKIDEPIETIEGAGTDNNLSFTFINADTADLYGVELEWFKNLDFVTGWVGDWAQGFFTSGNLTWSDSTLEIGSANTTLTNTERPLTQQSDWIVNLQLGYDAPSERHGATLVYNFYSERLFYAGRNGAQDAYEQPFNSLDFVYSYYPTEKLYAKLRFQNILDEQIEIEQGGVVILEQELGTSIKLDFGYRF